MPGSFPPNNDNFSNGFPAPVERFLQSQNRRKFSFPATIHSTSLLEVNQNSARRRLSNVSDVVTRKLSYTIGWKAAQIPAQDIINQGRCICGQYIKRRLRRSGLFNKKLGLQRIRSILGTSSMNIVRDVFPAVMVLGDELERMHPRVYTGVARQICRTPTGEFSVDTLTLVLSTVARDLFRTDITWSKIISLFAIAGGLSVDCVRQGHSEYLNKLMQSVSDVIEDELVPWINENGGWNGINTHVHPNNNSLNSLEWTTLVIGCSFGLFLLFLLIRFIIEKRMPSPQPARLRPKTKSASLDQDRFLQNRKSSEWKLHAQTSLTRAPSTSSLASTVTAGNYQEYKMEIINQGKCLCGQYIRARLRRAGVLNRKATQRLRSILEPSSDIVYEVFPALNSMGEELERMHPRVYTNVSRQLSRAPFGELEDSDTAPMLLNLVAKDLFRSSVTWGKIISIFAVCGGFAIDCVRQGHYDYLQYLVDGMAEIIEDDLAYWLADNGGWLGLQRHIRPQVGQFTFLGWLSLFVAVSSGVYVISNFIKHIGCHLYSLLF
ncbi:uncharacterized protein LOC119673953 [Teleopsis dalmanni]|uniref:uncharacterized protein LOC119673953 n=1 Tax=Teleopsis dalmanni TaxID=139649 RepID=UPI0018CF4BA1|nr:uncharacterized protein LOC119673953 [Teleopsis dalmanni]